MLNARGKMNKVITYKLLKSFWTSHLQMMKGQEPLFLNWTGKRKGIPKGVDETLLNLIQSKPIFSVKVVVDLAPLFDTIL